MRRLQTVPAVVVAASAALAVGCGSSAEESGAIPNLPTDAAMADLGQAPSTGDGLRTRPETNAAAEPVASQPLSWEGVCWQPATDAELGPDPAPDTGWVVEPIDPDHPGVRAGQLLIPMPGSGTATPPPPDYRC